MTLPSPSLATVPSPTILLTLSMKKRTSNIASSSFVTADTSSAGVGRPVPPDPGGGARRATLPADVRDGDGPVPGALAGGPPGLRPVHRRRRAV
ncbi:hypothetical protein THAOC_33276, partial [Thalassiosira oceanica]